MHLIAARHGERPAGRRGFGKMLELGALGAEESPDSSIMSGVISSEELSGAAMSQKTERLKKTVLSFAAFLLLVGVATFWSLERSAVFQICRNADIYSQHDSGSGEPQKIERLPDYAYCATEAFDANHDLLIALGTIFLAIFTGTLWWAAAGQYDLLEDQIALARDEFNATHRPKIKILSFETMTDGLSKADVIAVQFMYVNRGDAPAKITEIASKILTNNNRSPLRAGALLDRRKIEKTVLESGEQEAWMIESDILLAHHVRQQHPSLATPSGYAVRCIGYVEYLDARGIKRRTGFCRRLSPDGNTWVLEDNPDYAYEY